VRHFHVHLLLNLALLTVLSADLAGAQPVINDVAGLTGLINPQCADFRILGPCSCTGTQVEQACLWVAYHQPASVVETVPIPGDLIIGAGLISPGVVPGALVDALDFAGGSSALPQTSGHAALTFREAHVYSAPRLLPYGCNACDGRSIPDQPLLVPHYLSELDFAAWRYLPDGVANPIPIAGLNLAGVWGSLFPRIGFSQHDSPPVAAALLAWRAMAVAFNPAPGPGGSTPRTVILPAIGEPPVCFQVGYPNRSRCGLVGMNPLHWQLEKVEARGRNVFVFWEEKMCCVEPASATCGLAMSTGNEDNFCPAGYDPVFALVPGMPLDVPFDGK
jgi:hypothetical protein